MAAETQYTAVTGMVKISGANTGLDGSGTLGTNIWSVITGASNGTLIKTVTVKATGTTAQGMVRLFVYDGTNNPRLLKEIDVTPITPNADNAAFKAMVQLDFKLKSGYSLYATTQNNENYNVIAEGLNFAYYTNLVRPESTNYTANTGLGIVTTANTNLDGTSTVNILTAGASSSYNGCAIDSITIKAISSTETAGMVRLYIQNTGGTANTNTFLFMEVVIPNGQVPSGTYQSFERKIVFPNKLQIAPGYKITATTQIGESYTITVEGMDWAYPAATSVSNFSPASHTGDTTETILHALQVPANIFTTGNLMQVYASVTTNNGNNTTFKIYVNTANSLTGAIALGTYTETAKADNISRYFPIISNTVAECQGGTGTSLESQFGNNAGTSANSSSFTAGFSAGFYVLITGTLSNGADTCSLRWSMATKVF